MNRFSHKDIENSFLHVLKNINVDEKIAQLTVKGLIHTSLRGVDSHGIRLFPHYVNSVLKGRLNPTPNFNFQETNISTGKLDADHTFGHAAGIIGMNHTIKLAQKTGIGMVSVFNSSHCGALAYYALQACKYDMIGLAFTHASPKVKTPKSKRSFFGTNPLCFTAPMKNEDPYCFDSAPTLMPFNKIRQYREDDKELPENIATDKNGIETLNPHLATQLLPMADYKGFGLTMLVDVLCGLLTGMPVGNKISQMYEEPLSQRRYLGQVFIAIKIDSFEDPDIFKSRLQETCDKIRNEPKINPDSIIQVAGDPEKRKMKNRLGNGIPIKEFDINKINKLLLNYDVPSLKPMSYDS